MRTALLLLLALTGLTRGTSQVLRENRAADSALAPVFRDADRLLDAAALLFGDEPISGDFPDAFLDAIEDGGTDTGLTRAIVEVRRDFARGAPRDTIRTTFRRLFFAFHETHRALFRPAVFGHAGAKLLFFSASITCDCTRRLSDAYTRQLVQARRILGSLPPMLVLDCAADPTAMDPHGIETLPTILVLDGENRETSRFSVSEFILPLMIEHFQATDREE